MRRLSLISLLFLLSIVALSCSAETELSPEPVRGTTPPTATPPPSTDFRAFSFEALDGVTLAGAFYPPETSPAPGVLLLHMWQRKKEDWATLATQLQQNGYAVLALDLRGHGESGGEASPPLDGDLWTDDVRRAWAVMADQPSVDGERTAIVGASIGANLAIRAAAEEEAVRAVALLSPGLDYHGIATEEAMVAYGERPVLIVASEDDAYAAESAHRLAELAQGSQALTLYPRAGHGTAMLGSQPDLPSLILGWLGRQLR
jgi:alpha-beta hydrolase superfamily lysophospholipase